MVPLTIERRESKTEEQDMRDKRGNVHFGAIYGIAAIIVALAAGIALFGNRADAATTSNAGTGHSHDLTINQPNTLHVSLTDPEDLVPVDELPVVKGVLGFAPNAAPAPDRDYRAHVEVVLDVTEKVMRLADGVEYRFWTFGDTVPGPMIRVRHGDYVTFTLRNHPDSLMPHNIDLHAVTGQGGGAEATLISPGQQATFSFTALHPGVYIYHCATAPVGMHIANGMYGLIVVEPKEGFKPVDKEFYVVQGDFYTKGDFGERGLQDFDMQRAIKEDAAYVVFNGSVGSLVGENALFADVGDDVRIFFGNGGPNLTSSFHVIGEIFDTVNVEGGRLVNHDVQTTSVPAGGAVMVEFKVNVPGTYNLVDHAIFRAFNKGAVGQLVVVGDKDPSIFTERTDIRPFDPASEQ
ncbi:MAG TPA: copper-containing nitrite reductase [Trueperaceae bacterium]|nr:copper-containing nitrite reductase [Trueperaceae bacterium]